ncbi:hypothetical protein L208DRAFT_713045 [Tricholoma matsutake]|nr:hypothetical protein L208DRAFT_713045 [Tricholoma matsutake 945]
MMQRLRIYRRCCARKIKNKESMSCYQAMIFSIHITSLFGILHLWFQLVPRFHVVTVKSTYCRLMLMLLFKPWRNAADLREEYNCWSDALNAYMDTISHIQSVQSCKSCMNVRIIVTNILHEDVPTTY